MGGAVAQQSWGVRPKGGKGFSQRGGKGISQGRAGGGSLRGKGEKRNEREEGKALNARNSNPKCMPVIDFLP